jgi:hypothetical protein
MNNWNFPMIPNSVPVFFRELIERGWSKDRFERRSFEDIVSVMKRNNFEFAEGADIGEVLAFVDSVEKFSFWFE